MRSSTLLLPISLLALQLAQASDAPVSGDAVVAEMNLARQNPALYATYLEELRPNYQGNLFVSGHTRIRTKEGVKALDEAIRFLRSARPLQPFIFSPGMSKGAADHCNNQAHGGMGHHGSDGSSPGRRISRYGTWGSSWGENISYGKSTARDIVIQLIVDDGLRARKHRKNIFNSNFNYAGAASGPHARYRVICSIDFAGEYTERGQALVARNF